MIHAPDNPHLPANGAAGVRALRAVPPPPAAPVSAAPPSYAATWYADVAGPGAGPGAAGGGITISAVFRALLRRWPAALAAAAVLGAIGAFLGWRSAAPVYRAQATVRVEPYRTPILYETDTNGVMPMFDSFVQSQVQRIATGPIVPLALQRTTLGERFPPGDPGAVEAVRGSLTVASPRNSGLITLLYDADDPEVAALAVGSVARTFAEDLGRPATVGPDGRTPLETLEARRAVLAEAEAALRAGLAEAMRDADVAALEQLRDAKLSQNERVESARLGAKLATLGGEATAAAGQATTYDAERRRGLLRTRDDLEARLRQMEGVLGPRHLQRAAVERELEEVQGLLAELDAPTFAALRGDDGTDDEATDGPDVLGELGRELRGEAAEFGRRAAAVREVEAEVAQTSQRLREVERRIDQLTVEGSAVGAARVIDPGVVPRRPHVDKRRQLASVGGIGGAALGLLGVALIGLNDRRIDGVGRVGGLLTPHAPAGPSFGGGMAAGRDAAFGADAAGPRVVACLPVGDPLDAWGPGFERVPRADSGASPDAAVVAAAVSELRTDLLLQARRTGRSIYAITSPTPGDGKTSATVAVGYALAATGTRVLLVDLDLEGRALTRLLGGDRGRGDHRDHRDLRHAVAGEAVRACAVPAPPAKGRDDAALGVLGEIKAPDVLPLPDGAASLALRDRLSPAGVEAVVEAARREYDLVLIDTGPILAAQAARLAAAAADATLLVLNRGADRRAARDAAALIVQAGGTVGGLIFNRAAPRDVRASAYSASTSSSRAPD